MDDWLNNADQLLDAWEQAQLLSDQAATEHKHRTSAEIEAHAGSKGIGRAKEFVQASKVWLERQHNVDARAISAKFAHMRYEQAVRRWETERSYFAAGKRVV